MAMVKTKSRKENKNKITWKEIKRQKVLLFWAAVMVIYGIIFYYLPLGGWAMAFQNYKPRTGILHSEFVGLEKFRMLFSDMTFIRVIRNTLAMGVINLVVTFFTAIAFAVLLNEIKSKGGKKVVQTISYLPHFLSWVVIGGIMLNLFSPVFGLAGQLFRALGMEPINIMAKKNTIFWVVIISDIWKEAGWSTIVFLAALTQVDMNLYEAARMDGANKFQQMLHITLPAISSIVVVMLILRIGKVMNAGFEQILVLQNPITMEKIDIFDTFVYREGLGRGSYSFAAAVDTFKSVIALILVTSANKISKMFGEEGIV